MRNSGAPMPWSIYVGEELLVREGEPFCFFWRDVASLVFDRECEEGGHTDPVSLRYKGEAVTTFWPV